MINLPEWVTEDDLEQLCQEVDPDWTDHFLTVDQAMNFYQDAPSMDVALKQLKKDKQAEKEAKNVVNQ